MEWSPFPFPRDLLNPGIEPRSAPSPPLQAESLPAELYIYIYLYIKSSHESRKIRSSDSDQYKYAKTHLSQVYLNRLISIIYLILYNLQK